MRPSRSRATVAAAALSALALVSALPASARAQGGGDALFLLLPVGARAVALGQAAVALSGGSEQLWWNPAGVAWQRQREIAIHHSATIAGQGNALAFVLPIGRAGVAAASVSILDFGQQAVTDDQGQLPIGVLFPQDVAYALTYALAASKSVALGASVKQVRFRVDCQGRCANLPIGGSTFSAIDLGTQIRVSEPLTLALAARNIAAGRGRTTAGRLDAGASYRLSFLDSLAPGISARVAGSVATATSLDSVSSRVGLEVGWEQRFTARGGYVVSAPYGSGPSLGFGLTAGRLVFDFARKFGSRTDDQNRPPTYFSLRFLF